MKNILLILGFFCTFLQFANAQQTSVATITDKEAIKAAAQSATDLLATKYSLTQKQYGQMYAIQKRKLNNLAEIESLKTSDTEKYWKKYVGVQKGTLGSIQRLLETPAQLEIFKKTQAEVRMLKSVKSKELLSSGLSKKEVETALLDIYKE